MKSCRKCNRELPFEAFNNYKRSKDGKQSYCRECQSEICARIRRERGKEIDKATWQRRKNDPEKLKKKKLSDRKWREAHPEKYKEIWKRTNREYKIKVLAAVSGGKIRCANCGCDQVEFLEVNHINGGGAREYKHGGNNKKMYAAILSGERDTCDLNILCKPCNNLHYLELKFGKLPYEIIWKGCQDEQSPGLQ